MCVIYVINVDVPIKQSNQWIILERREFESGDSLGFVKAIISSDKIVGCFLTSASPRSDCRSAVIAITISYPWSLIACRHGWIHGGSAAIPYPRCRFASIHGAAKKSVDCGWETNRQRSDVVYSSHSLSSYLLVFIVVIPLSFSRPRSSLSRTSLLS